MKHILLIVFIIFTFTTKIFSQAVVKGVVKGQINQCSCLEPLVGVNIYYKDSTINGTISDLDGSYTLKIPEGNTTIIFECIGFKTFTKEITAQNREYYNLNVEMEYNNIEFAVDYIFYESPFMRSNYDYIFFNNQEYDKYYIKLIDYNFAKIYSQNNNYQILAGCNIEPEINIKPNQCRDFYINTSATFLNYYNGNTEDFKKFNNININFNTIHLGIKGNLFNNLSYNIGYFRNDYNYNIEPFYNYDNYTFFKIKDGISLDYDRRHLNNKFYFSMDDFNYFQKNWNKKYTIINKTKYELFSYIRLFMENIYKNHKHDTELKNNESKHILNSAIGINYSVPSVGGVGYCPIGYEAQIMYIQSNNFDENISIKSNIGKGFHTILGFVYWPHPEIIKGSISYTYGKDFQTAEGHDFFSIINTEQRKLSILTEEIYCNYSISKLKRVCITLNIRNYNNFINKTNMQSYEIGIHYQPTLLKN